MDFETGEGIPDKETGELPVLPKINAETGEYEYCYRTEATTEKSRGFKIPPYLINRNICKVMAADTSNIETRLVFSGMKSNTPIFLFVIPTIILVIPAFIIVLLALEMILHSWAHKKNKVLSRDNIDNIYYRSPYHVVVREFCPMCLVETSNEKINKIQDKRTRRLFIKYGLDYVKRVV